MFLDIYVNKMSRRICKVQIKKWSLNINTKYLEF